MRVLLDAHLSPRIAEELRGRGRDAVSVGEVGLAEASDEDVLRWAIAQRRAIVTRNARDFRPLHALLMSRGEPHYGLIFVGRADLPRGAAIGELARRIDDMLGQYPDDDALAQRERWL